MSLKEVYRDRHYDPAYIYIAASVSTELIKIGVTKNIGKQEYKLRYERYGDIGDWKLVYFVYADSAGNLEHAARRSLKQCRVLRLYEKNRQTQQARELLRCSFSDALEALLRVIGGNPRKEEWRSEDWSRYDWPKFIADEILVPPPRLLEGVRVFSVGAIDLFLFNRIQQLEFELPLRTIWAFRDADINRVGDLVWHTEADLLRLPNFGRRSLHATKDLLQSRGLRLGMEISWWPQLAEHAHLFDRLDLRDFSLGAAMLLEELDLLYGDLATKNENELLRLVNLSRKCLNEVKGCLEAQGLRPGMDIPWWYCESSHRTTPER